MSWSSLGFPSKEWALDWYYTELRTANILHMEIYLVVNLFEEVLDEAIPELILSNVEVEGLAADHSH